MKKSEVSKKAGQNINTRSSENKIQTECFVYFHNKYPDLRGLLCYNLNNSKNKIDGNKNKSMGLQAGRSDMVLYYKSRAYMIEFKTELGTQSTVQKEWQSKIESQGLNYYIIRSKNKFISLINGILM